MHAVFWSADGTIRDLGTPPGDAFSVAAKINLFGLVIGTSGNTVRSRMFGLPVAVGRPFIWSERSGMRDLNTLIRGNSSWVLNTATDINVSFEDAMQQYIDLVAGLRS